MKTSYFLPRQVLALSVQERDAAQKRKLAACDVTDLDAERVLLLIPAKRVDLVPHRHSPVTRGPGPDHAAYYGPPVEVRVERLHSSGFFLLLRRSLPPSRRILSPKAVHAANVLSSIIPGSWSCPPVTGSKHRHWAGS